MASVSDPSVSVAVGSIGDGMRQWIRICHLDDIPVLGARVLQMPGVEPIALFRSEGERVFALLDRCPHKGGPLSQGLVAGDSVTCPLHAWQIDLNSGQACAPDVGCARRFPVRVQAGEVWLSLQDPG